MSLARADVIAAVRQNLKEVTSNAMYSDTELGIIIDQVLREITTASPKVNRIGLALTARSIDISTISWMPLSNMMDMRVAYPVGNNLYTPTFRDFSIYGNELKLDLSFIPTIVSGTLTGTITFTSGSQTVTGSGTKFLTELVAGDQGHLICKSSGTPWYQVSSITSDTVLVLGQPYAGTTGADTISLTKYRDRNSCVMLEYGSTYTVSTSSDLPTVYDNVLCLGTFAHALKDYVSSRITTNDLQGDTDLASARSNANTVNVGGDVVGKYTNIAQLEKVESYRSTLGTLHAAAIANWQMYQDALNNIGNAEYEYIGNFSRD